MIKVASVQFNHVSGDKEANIEIIRGFCAEASRSNVQIIAFPEMCITGYWHIRNLSKESIKSLSEHIPTGKSVLKLKEISNKHNLILGAGLIEESDEGKFYNSYVVVHPNGQINCHRKIHCFISEYYYFFN